MSKVDYNELFRMTECLDAAAAAGTLTECDLAKAVRTTFDEYDSTPNNSVGTGWITSNPQLFAKVVQNPFEFFTQHLDVEHCSEQVLLHAELLLLMSPIERAVFVTAAFVANGARSGRWVGAALSAGVDRVVVREAQRARLVASPFTMSGQQGCITLTPCGTFLRQGMYLPERLTVPNSAPWSLFDDDDFRRVLAICVEKDPMAIFHTRKIIGLRIPAEEVQQLCTDAAKKLTRIDTLRIEDLRLLPLKIRSLLAWNMEKPNTFSFGLQVQFLIELLLEEEYDSGLIWGKMEHLDPLDVYRIARVAIANTQSTKAEAVESRLRQRVGTEHVFGVIEEGQYRGSSQWQVRSGNTIFVQDRNAHRYAPTAGDEVVFEPSKGKRLTPNVVAVYFVPVDLRKDR